MLGVSEEIVVQGVGLKIEEIKRLLIH